MAKVAFLGLGVMGFPMAGHLAAKGHDVTVYNRTFAKAEAWTQKHKGKAAKTPKEAAAGQEIVFSCVGNDEHLRAVVLGDNGAFAGMGRGTIFFDNTTASADIARELHAEGKRAKAAMPLVALVDQFYDRVQQRGGGRWDTCSLIQPLQKP